MVDFAEMPPPQQVGDNRPPERKSILGSVFERITNSSDKGKMANSQIPDMAPIESVTVPKNWQKEFNEGVFGDLAKSVTFTPPDAKDTNLTVYDRGYPIPTKEADSLKALLGKPAHKLTADEMAELGPGILGTVGDASAFNMTGASTTTINGKSVLKVEGDWKTSGKKFVGYYIPEGSPGGKMPSDNRAIKEMYFEGREPQFSQHLPQATKAIEGVTWKSNEPPKTEPKPKTRRR
ncbi:MAG: hypothetical protein K2X93_11425 [Candidatus Obscuribacterales bacterium]|nr:hypothetical protein [Candidatus Obscuribacterales bacterium]